MKEISFPSYYSFCDVALVSRDFKSKETSEDQTGRVSNSNMTKWSPIRSVYHTYEWLKKSDDRVAKQINYERKVFNLMRKAFNYHRIVLIHQYGRRFSVQFGGRDVMRKR